MWHAAGPPLRRISVGHVALALPAVAIVIAARLPIRDNSYLWHVRAGTLQIDVGEVLTSDPFSFTALGRNWRTQSWLMDLLYGLGDRLFGLGIVGPLVVVGSVLLVGAFSLRVCQVVGSPLRGAIGTIWITWLVLGYFTPRPVLFSLALLAVLLVAADDERLRWSLPLFMWLWASIHGGFIVGIGYLILDGLRRGDKRRVVDAFAATVASSLSAHGWATWGTVWEFSRRGEELDLIVEWLTPNFISLGLFPFAIGILALLLGGVRGQLTVRDMWVVGPFLLFAFTANRAVPIAALVLLPWLVAILQPATRTKRPPTRREALFNSLLVGVLMAVPWLIPIQGGLDEEVFALGALEHLGEGRVFHDDAIGGYLIYAQWPERLVYIDDRAELYQEDYAAFANARAGKPIWREVFDRHDIGEALLEETDPLAEVLAAAGWEVRYQDEQYVILVDPQAGQLP